MSISRCISLASREKREGEVDGEIYFFKTKEEIKKKQKNKELLQYIEFNNEIYGYEKSEFKDIDELIVLIGGSGTGKDTVYDYIKENMKENFQNQNVKILFSIPETIKIFDEYAKKHGIKIKKLYIDVEEKERFKRIIYPKLKQLLKENIKKEDIELNNLYKTNNIKIKIKDKIITMKDELYKDIIKTTQDRIKRDGEVFTKGVKKIKNKYNIKIIKATDLTIAETAEKIIKDNENFKEIKQSSKPHLV
jgi:hypothetical protein